MKAETRTKHLMTLLGWQGGTVHDACAEVGLDVNEFLYGDVKDFFHFRRGHADASDIALYLSANKGNLPYWIGAISAVNHGVYLGPKDVSND